MLRGALRGRQLLLGLLFGEARVGTRLGREGRGELAEVGSDLRNVLVLEVAGELFHHEVLAPAMAVLIERPHQVVGVLPGERGIDRRHCDAVLAVAGDAQLRSLRDRARGLPACRPT